MALKIIKQTDLAEAAAEREAKEQRVVDLELTLTDQMLANLELQARLADVELVLADILAGGDK